MKSSLSLHLAALLAVAAISLCSCEVARQVPFDEADFQSTAGTGSGSVTGQAFVMVTPMNWDGLLRRSKDTHHAGSTDIVLLPVTAYTNEVIQKKYVEGSKLAEGDPRYYKYTRTRQTDGNGNFRFTGIHPGDYYVGCEVSWGTYFDWYDDSGMPERINHNNTMLIYARVSVRNGQTATVTQWHQGKQKQDSQVTSR